MTIIVNTKLGEHRGKNRFWLEGEKLLQAGYTPGTKFDLELNDRQILLHASDEGKFTVSRRNRNGVIQPIIDLKADELSQLFQTGELLRVAIRNGKIVISAHHQQARIRERIERLARKLATGEPLSVCSLFHGGGVLDRAFHKGLSNAGVRSKIAVAVELEGQYLDSSLRNNPKLWDKNSIVIESPIQDVDLSKAPPEVDLCIAGLPCTGASKAGRSKNKLEFAESHDEAGAMFFNFLQFVQKLNPSIVVIENVPEYQGTASMVVIRSVLQSLGYKIQERILDGNEFGALEDRKRLCAVAISSDVDGFDLSKTESLRKKESRISEILEDVPQDSPRWKSFDYLAAKEARDKAAGKGFRRQLLTGDSESCGCIGRHYAKCRSTEPFLINPEIPSESRLFTPAEHCRIKAIPEQVISGLSDTIAHQILGQSIVFPVFEAVATSIGNSIVSWSNTQTLYSRAA
ncbi:MAG: DNA cytosine methyltransferase [Thiopseudomonas sp.]